MPSFSISARQILSSLLFIILTSPFVFSGQEQTPYSSFSSPFFVKNSGQWDKRALLLSRTKNLDLWLRADGITYDVYRLQTRQYTANPSIRPISVSDKVGNIVALHFDNARLPENLEISDELATRFNYFIGNDSSRWASDVPLFRSGILRSLYDGIDLKLTFDGEHPRYDFIVQPNANVADIALRWEGMKSVFIPKNDELHIETSVGTLIQSGLKAYQDIDGERKFVACSFVLEKNTVRFAVGEYNHSYPLIIDPIVFGSFLGGVSLDEVRGVSLDANRNVYVVGSTVSSNFPTTAGAYDTSHTVSNHIFISKFNTAGNQLSYSTFLGGTQFTSFSSAVENTGYDIAVTSGGSAYVTGYTNTIDFPMASPYQSTIYGTYDAFVSRISSDGKRLEYSTFIGGSNADFAYSIALNSGGQPHIVGATSSNDFPLQSQFQNSRNGAYNAFITKFSSSGTALDFSSYLGGSGNTDRAWSIALDGSGNMYVVGETNSTDFPTVNAYDGTYGGSSDAFFTKINGLNYQVAFSSYLGGTQADAATGVAVDASSNVYISGYTGGGTGFPATNSAGGGEDGFMVKVNSGGSTLGYAYYIGGSNTDRLVDIGLDGTGNVYATGFTSSTNYPKTDNSSLGGGSDIVLTKLGSSGSLPPSFSTIMGGNNDDQSNGIAVDIDGNAYLGGRTQSANFPVTSGAADTTFNGSIDAFVVKFGTGAPSVIVNSPNGGETWCNGTRRLITWTSTSVTYVNIQLSRNGGVSYDTLLASNVPAALGSWQWNIPANFAPGIQYRIRIVNTADATVIDVGNANFAIYSSPSVTGQPADTSVCENGILKLRSAGQGFPAPSVQWQEWTGTTWANIAGGTGATLTISNMSVSKNGTRYRVVYANFSCNAEAISTDATVSVLRRPQVITQPPATVTICAGKSTSITLDVDQANVSFSWEKYDGFVWQSAGIFTQNLSFASASQSNAGKYRAVISGQCPPAITSATVEVKVQDVPRIVTDPIIFRKAICPSEQIVTTITIQNRGPLKLTVKAPATSDNPCFKVLSPTVDFSLESGFSTPITVQFTPTKAGVEQGTITFQTEPCGLEFSIFLGASADSLRVAARGDLQFLPTAQCDTAQYGTLRLENTGVVDVMITDTTFSDAQFKMIEPKLPFALPKAKYQDVLIRFKSNGTVNPNITATATFKTNLCNYKPVANLIARRDTLAFILSKDTVKFPPLLLCETSSTGEFDMYNTGTAPLRIIKISSDNPAFGVVTGLPIDIPVGFQPKKVAVQFNGGTGGIVTGKLTILNEGCPVPRTLILRGEKQSTLITPSVASVQFGERLGCSTSPDTLITLTNSSSDVLFIDSAFASSPFEVIAPVNFPKQLAQGGKIDIQVRFSALTLNSFSGMLLIPFRSGLCSDTLRIPLAGSRIAPEFTAFPQKIDTLRLGACALRADTVIHIRNTGKTPIQVKSASIGAPFSVVETLPLPQILPGGESAITVRFDTGGGQQTGNDVLHLTLNPCDSSVFIPIFGIKQGISYKVSNDTVNFGTVYQCATRQTITAKIFITMSNTVADDTQSTISSISVPAPFSTTLKPGFTLTRGIQQDIDITFSPQFDGDYTNIPFVLTMQPCGVQRTIYLNGSRKSAQFSAKNASVSMQAQAGQKIRKQLAFLNTGSGTLQIDSVGKLSAPFSIISTTPDVSSSPKNIPAGDSIMVEVEYFGTVGTQSTTATVFSSVPCILKASTLINGEGADIPTTTLSALDTLDFGTIEVGTQVSKSFALRNVGASKASIFQEKISGKDKQDFTLQSAVTSINAGTSATITIAFKPSLQDLRLGLYEADYNGTSVGVVLRGYGKNPAMMESAVYLPDTTLAVGAKNVRLPLKLIPGQNFVLSAADTFRTEIHWNPTVFVPKSVENAIIEKNRVENGKQVLVIRGKVRGSTELCTIIGDVLLGNASSTPLAFQGAFTWNNRLIFSNTQNGLITLDSASVCRLNDRLITINGEFGLTSIAPNPADGDAQILVETVEAGIHVVEIYDVSGRLTWREEWQTTSDSPSARRKILSVHAAGLPAGAYMVVLRSPARSAVRHLLLQR